MRPRTPNRGKTRATQSEAYQVFARGTHDITRLDAIWGEQILFLILALWVIDQRNVCAANGVVLEPLDNAVGVQNGTRKINLANKNIMPPCWNRTASTN